ncbi:MAG: NAD kinase [Flavobacteriaceae bacterium]|nr:NAD kinase [Flavobacteriaceae bacterium]|tara:strand:+ start:1503 stop:2381 length:879 start_codon:yes stop_codon:yes gene_type:complete
MKIALFSQELNEDVKSIFDKIINSKFSENFSFFLHKNLKIDEFDFLNKSFFKYSKANDLKGKVDLIISVGGDGTFLRSIEYVKNNNIPILGINTGRLGFLASTKKENIEKSIEKIFNKKFKIEERSLIKVSLESDKQLDMQFPYALNEISVVRKDTTSMVNINTSLNGIYLNSYWSDGLIVSTPTGSTGYSLSCGGPIISPSSESLVLTPISPHNLNARPLVISDSTKISISVSGREQYHLLSIDSKVYTVKNGTKILVEKSDFNIKVANLNNYNFYKTLKEKLLWGKDKRN